MSTPGSSVPDVMQVCRNGHVITDRLTTYPDRGLAHCDQCGATTLDRCPTCGQALLGASHVPGMVPLGKATAPECCFACGALFPWAQRRVSPPPADPLAGLENLLRRLPVTIRRLRTRHADRPPFRVRDEHDLEDLLRAVLPLQFDEVRSESRTPSYDLGTRTDFRLGHEGGELPLALTCKMVKEAGAEEKLLGQWREDVAYYQRQRGCNTLVGFVYDPEMRLREPRRLETVWAELGDDFRLRCVIAS
jgi:hypothetical protein